MSPDGGKTYDPEVGVRVARERLLVWGAFVVAVLVVILGALYINARGNARDKEIANYCPPGMELSQEELATILDQREMRGEEAYITPQEYACLDVG